VYARDDSELGEEAPEMSEEPITYNLDARDIPTAWFNIMPDLARRAQPLPPLNPMTKEPVGPDDLAPLFPMSLIGQEVSTEEWIDIPGPVLDIYRLWRPTPLYRARRLEQALDTPAHIYFKYEGVSPAGSHKPNTAVPQAYFNKEAGIRRIATETGAGQWGSAMAMACGFLGLECTVYMVRASFDQKPYRRVFMETFGARVLPSPSDSTNAGRSIRAQDPDSTGSLGIAISEAVEDAATHDDTSYALGSVLGHVLLHQTVMGLEAKRQMEMAGEDPDVIIGCVGGGSNFAGLSYPFMSRKLRGETPDLRFLAVEPAACPTLTKGTFAYDYGDTAQIAPIVPMFTLGHGFVPAPVHAGGLRYHGDAPSLSLLVREGYMEARAYPQNAVFEAAVMFAKTLGIVPAPEPAHAIRGAIDEATAARDAGEERVILFNLCGHGHFDMQAYDDYLNGRLPEVEFDPADERAALADLPEVPINV
jgi:tryptophan synthase beta chain